MEIVDISPLGPRKVKFSKSYINGIWILLAVLGAILCVGFGIAWNEKTELQNLKDHGKIVDGVVTRKWRTRGKSTSYDIDYRYFDNGIAYDGEESVSLAKFDSLYEGEHSEVTVLPSKPAVHVLGRVSQERIDDSRSRHFLGILFFGGIAFFLWLARTFQSRTDFVSLRDWEATEAIVIRIGPILMGKLPLQEIDYSYEIRPGVRTTQTAKVAPSRISSFTEGMTVKVLVNPLSPESTRLVALLDSVTLG